MFKRRDFLTLFAFPVGRRNLRIFKKKTISRFKTPFALSRLSTKLVTRDPRRVLFILNVRENGTRSQARSP